MTIESVDKKHVIFKTKEALFFFLANELQRYSEFEVTQHISLSGGSTPKGLFSYITSSQFKQSIQWQNLHFWWGDERCVEFKDEQSNYGEAKRLLFDHIDIPKRNVHVIPLDLFNTIEDYQLVAESYASKMKQVISIINEYPVYDWILLGVGEDGHTASLFPFETD
jgi:6-phosphogluconolactonase